MPSIREFAVPASGGSRTAVINSATTIASQRIANSAYLTRERVGRGQVILFSGEPNFRGAALGTNRLWLNAVIYGAGLGTSSRIDP